MMSEIPRMSSPSLPSLFTLVFIFLLHLSTAAAGGDHHRHLLHQPFFPVLTSPPPPVISPSPSPSAQPPSGHHHHNHSQPQKHPFSSVPTPNAPSQNQPNPFFPSTDAASSSPPPPPSPPPPSATLATFPANISSLLLPSTSSHQHHHVKKLLAITISAVSAALILSLLAFLILLRRHRRFSSPSTAAVPDDTKSARSDSLRLFNTAPSDSTHHLKQAPPKYTSSNTSSEFLYLGTLVNSRSGGIDQQNAAVSGVLGIPFPASTSSSSQYQKLGSPELRPLPPLPKYNAFTPNYLSGEQLNHKRDDENDDGDNNEENDEFFSPRGSSGRKQSPPRVLSSSRRDLQGIGVDHFGSTSFNSRTASYPYSNSCSPSNSMSSTTASQGTNPSPRSLKSKSPDSIINFPVQHQPTNPSPTPFPSFSPALGNAQNEIDRIYGSQSRNAQNDSVPRYLAPKRPPPPPPPPRFSEIPVESKVSHPNDANLGIPATIIDHGNEDRKENEELEKKEETLKPKLKPLHWDKVRASSSHVMVWDQIKSNSFQLNEEMIETLFRANDPNLKGKDLGGRQVVQSLNHETRVLDPKKSQNIAILLRALNVTADEVCEALMEGNADTLGPELLECLLKMAPTKEEERKLNEFRDDGESPFKLGPAERFLKALLKIPFAFERVDSMLYIVNFDSEIEYLNRSFMTLEAACGELRNTRMFLKLLEAVLKTGNRMNVGTNRGDAHAFKLDTLLKLVDIKGTDGKTTLLHFVVQEITKSEGSRLSGKKQSSEIENKTEQSILHDDIELRKVGLQVVSSLGGEMTNVKKAAAMDSDVLNNEITKIASGIAKVKEIIKLNEEESLVLLIDEKSNRFLESMNAFLNRAQEDIAGIEARGRNAFSMVKEATDYFHGNSSKEEAHPFRIFAVVRDFLSILDRVCKEVGKINDRTLYGTARPAPASQNGPQLFPELQGRQEDSSFSDDDSSG